MLRMLKPIPMILMIVYISGKSVHRDYLVISLIRAGLIVSLIGDIFLMVNELLAFMIGTGFFFIGHVLYCAAFTIGTTVRVSSNKNKIFRRFIVLGLFMTFFLNIYSLW